MIEKPNKDGKPPTMEYQEEEMLVSPVGGSPDSLSFFLLNIFLDFFFFLRTLFMVLLLGNATACIR